MRVKRGASIDRCSGRILSAAIKIEPIITSYGVDELVITEGEATIKHSVPHSRHYFGDVGESDAIDIRSRDLRNYNLEEIARKIRRKLGPNYYVKVEKTHFHIHWAPVWAGVTDE